METGEASSDFGNLGSAYRSLAVRQGYRAPQPGAGHLPRDRKPARPGAATCAASASPTAASGSTTRPSSTRNQALATPARSETGEARANDGNLGEAYRSLGQYDKAIEHHNQAAISRETGPARRGHPGHPRQAYLSLGQYDKAIEHYNQALAISTDRDRRGEGSDWATSVRLLQPRAVRQGHRAANQALAISRKIETGEARAATWATSATPTTARAVRQGHRAPQPGAGHLPRDRDPRGEGSHLGNLGNAYNSLGQYDEAIEHSTRRWPSPARSETGEARAFTCSASAWPTCTAPPTTPPRRRHASSTRWPCSTISGMTSRPSLTDFGDVDGPTPEPYLQVVHAKLAEQRAHEVRDHPMALGSASKLRSHGTAAAIEAAERAGSH